MKMKTDRGKRKVGRRLGLSNADQKQAVRRVRLNPPVDRGTLERRPEEEAPRRPEPESPPPRDEEATRPSDGEQS